MAAASSRALLFSPLIDISNHCHHKLRHLHLPPSFPTFPPPLPPITVLLLPLQLAPALTGGVFDDFVSTNSYHEFSLIANMLKKIEPLDTSVISNGVSDSIINSMEQMISTMLGLLPSDQFSVTVTVSKRPLVRLLASSLITGLNSGDCNEAIEADQIEENEQVCEELETLNLQSCLADLSSDATDYIQKLESELSTTNKDLHTQKQETKRIGYATESNNNLLKYLRSLDLDMVKELSRPSSSEVKEVLQQLVHHTDK